MSAMPSPAMSAALTPTMKGGKMMPACGMAPAMKGGKMMPGSAMGHAMKGGKMTRKMKRSVMKGKSAKKGKGTPWTKFVKKVYDEMKRKDKNAKLGDAMKMASKRKSEM